MLPLFPLTAVPLLKYNAPLEPATPLFVDRILMSPLLVAVPSPLAKLNRPPVLTVLRPAIARICPPTPLVPLPTVMVSDPPDPDVAAPVPIQI